MDGDTLRRLARAALPVVAILSLGFGTGATLASAGDTLGYDFLAYHRAAARLLAGEPLYDVTYTQTGGFGLFYYPPAADPAVIAADNASADFWTGGQVTSTFLAFLYPSLAPEIDGVSRVTGPVLIQLGEFDALFPAGNDADETALWSSTAPTVQSIAGIGHNFNLHLNRHQSWDGIATWLSATLDWR